MFFVFSLVVLFRSYKSAKRPHKLVYQEPLNDLKNKVKTNETKSITSLWVCSKSFIGCHFASGQTRNDKENEKKKKIEGGEKKEHCNLHVIQIVSKECVILTLFTQPSRSRNVEFILHEIP